MFYKKFIPNFFIALFLFSLLKKLFFIKYTKYFQEGQFFVKALLIMLNEFFNFFLLFDDIIQLIKRKEKRRKLCPY